MVEEGWSVLLEGSVLDDGISVVDEGCSFWVSFPSSWLPCESDDASLVLEEAGSVVDDT